MDFFEAQARAKQRTSRLIALFGLAVAGTVGAAYLAAVLILHFAVGNPAQRARLGDYDPRADAVDYWQPKLLGLVGCGTLLVVAAASLYKWREYSAGGSAVAESVGGRRVEPNTIDLHERRLLNVVEEMAIASGTPVPVVYILDDEPAINAFAAGLTTSDAVVAVTRGTLEKLTRDELQGVVGHEFSHILNGDMRLNLRIAATIFGILVIGLAGRGILWSLRHARIRSREKNGGGLIIALAAAGLALLIIGYVGYFFGRLIQAAVSRQREFLADASAVQFTRNPPGLTGALKKIGGYALGSKMQSSKSAAIGHFFFAQGFRSGFAGLLATHPPLEARIRAIDPSFDGQPFEPPEVVDVANESFVGAGLAPAARRTHDRLVPAAAGGAVQSIGTVTPENLTTAQHILAGTPDRLRLAAQTPQEARILIFGLLMHNERAVRVKQRAAIADRIGPGALDTLDGLEPFLRQVQPGQKLPLVQLALPALRHIQPAALPAFFGALDELVHADGQVSPFEYALQKLLRHSLELGRHPGRRVEQYQSFNALTDELSVLLSTLARASTGDGDAAPAAFAAGAAQLKLVESKLSYQNSDDKALTGLDGALEKLSVASLVIKQRTLAAAAEVVGADGTLSVAESELLRAIAATLDCPMPPLPAALKG
jgi:Zn-dependent protease with chaperone function/uncharacterized tellurite resistance protein B-like protein